MSQVTFVKTTSWCKNLNSGIGRQSGERERCFPQLQHGRSKPWGNRCVPVFRGLIVGALKGTSKEEILSTLFSAIPGYWERCPHYSEVEEVARGSFKHRNPSEIRGRSYVVKSLEAALWAFHKSSSFGEGCLMAVNLGEDADTTGAIYGQIAGVYYGVGGIPEEWLGKLAHRSLIETLPKSFMVRYRSS